MVVCLLETKITNLFRTNPIQKFGTRANEALIVTEAFAFCSFQKNLKTGTNDFNAYVTLQVIQSKQFRKQNWKLIISYQTKMCCIGRENSHFLSIFFTWQKKNEALPVNTLPAWLWWRQKWKFKRHCAVSSWCYCLLGTGDCLLTFLCCSIFWSFVPCLAAAAFLLSSFAWWSPEWKVQPFRI